MREYGKLKTAFWRNRKIRGLCERAKLLAAYLISCPHGNSVGCFVLPFGYVAEDLDWDIKVVRERLTELAAINFIERDDDTCLIRIAPWWEHNTIENPNVAKSAIKEIKALPNCSVKQRLIDCAKPSFNCSETVAKLFSDAFSEPVANREPNLTYPEPNLTEPEPDAPAQDADDLSAMVGEYNALAEKIQIPKVVSFDGDRKRKARARLKAIGGIDKWREALAKLEANPWMHGANDKGWRADFNFLLQAESFTKLLEGSYDRANKPFENAKPNRSLGPSNTVQVEPHALRISSFRNNGFWPPMAGPKPGQRGCTAPDDLLTPDEVDAKYGREKVA
jgi:hypothetical protein